MTLASDKSPNLLILEYSEINKISVFKELKNGRVIIIRGADPIRSFHGDFLTHISKNYSPEIRNEIEAFYENKMDLSFPASLALSNTIKLIREQHLLGKYLAPLVHKLNAPAPVLLHNGISRLVINRDTLNNLKNSSLFDPEDFKRKDGLGNTEIFMPEPAPIHRDYNRNHFLFMINIWFPMHDLTSNEVIRIYPQHYHQQGCVLDTNESQSELLGEPLKFEMKTGDMVLFHSEQPHSSPSRNTYHEDKSDRRHSFDFRVAAHCNDNNQHYRNNFFNLHNFMISSIDCDNNYFETSSIEEGSDLIIDIILALKTNKLGAQDLEKCLSIFDSAPFSEDRYLELADFLPDSQAELRFRCLESVTKNSNSPFWLLQTAKQYKKLDMQTELNETVRKIIALIDHLPLPPDYMPIKYSNPTIQLSYADIRVESLNLLCKEASQAS